MSDRHDTQIEFIQSAASITTCSVRWHVQVRDDTDRWVDLPQMSSDNFDVARRNMAHKCQSLISELGRHRVVRRLTVDFLEQTP